MEENKSVSFKVEDGKLVVQVDPNKDGQALLTVHLDIAEVPDEVIELFKKKK